MALKIYIAYIKLIKVSSFNFNKVTKKYNYYSIEKPLKHWFVIFELLKKIL